MPSVRILIVDDHEVVRRELVSLLSARADWSVCGVADDGIRAVEQAKALRPDVVLMDISMPRMNGLDATRIIRRELPETRVVIVSQNDPEITRQQAEEVRAHGCISKSDLSFSLIPVLEELLLNSSGGNNGSAPAPAIAPQTCDQERQSGKTNAPKTTGEMAALIQSKNWAETAIGAMNTWSPRLRMMVDFLLSNRFPLLLWWGPQYVSIYNDAYIPVLGKKHPSGLGLPVSECWSEIWPVLKPLIDTPFNGGPSTWIEDFELEIRRSGFAEETHFTVAYSPVPDEVAPNGIGGVLATVHEITEKIINERRVACLARLSAHAMEGKAAESACEIFAEALSTDPKDVPFALIYLINRQSRKAELAGMIGALPGDLISPARTDLDAPSSASDWPLNEVLNEVLQTEKSVVVHHLENHFRAIPRGPWAEPPRAALAMPIQSSKAHDLAGVLIVGLSSRLELNDSYRSFLDLLAAQIATSITNARAYEEERRRAEALAEIDRAKTLFFSNVSHEFRTPLTLLLGPLEDILKNSDALKAPQREQIEVAHRNSLRLLKLVNTLLDFSRIEAGRAKPHFQKTDLSAFTRELASVFRSAMERAGLKFIVDCPPFPQEVSVDRDMWEKIVFNLLSNAFKFTPSGEVHLSLGIDDANAVLSVRDTGSGIPSWELPHIFERFHRVEGARGRTQEGTGIGLALAQELVKLHDGTTEVESKLGVGTTFRVRVPLGEERTSRAASPAAPLVSTALRGEAFVEEALTWLPREAQELARKEWKQQEERAPIASAINLRARVLLAEDNADMRDYLRRLLTPSYEVEAVENGKAALLAARKLPPDLILSDVMMAEMDGFELVKTLRDDESLRSIPIILLSARAGEEEKIEGVSRGADDYLIKPFSARELLARVATHLQLARLRKKMTDDLEQAKRDLEDEVQNRTLELQQRNTTLIKQSEQLSDLSGRLLQTQDAERRHLARELHDGVGQILAVLAMNANRIAEEAGKNAPSLAETAVETRQLVEKLTREIRTTSYLLHPPLLDDNGLASALRWYVEGLRKRSGLEIELEISETLGRAPKELELAIFRLVQESLTNVHRHSGSAHARIRIARDKHGIVVEVADGGRGIAPEKLAEIQLQGSGVGIQGMRERTRLFGGKMDIESNSRGTKIRITLPCEAAARAAPHRS